MLRKLCIIAVLFVIASVISANAHEWYDAACCSGHDCHVISCEEITEKGKSLFYKGYEFYNTMIRPSQDGQCHACISNEFSKEYTPVPHCLYIQQGS